MIGWYSPNMPGARTPRDARPLYVGCDKVEAQVYKLPASDQCFIAIFVGVNLVHEGPLPLEIADAHDVNPFVQRFIANYAGE
jgi:hypothetical protein